MSCNYCLSKIDPLQSKRLPVPVWAVPPTILVSWPSPFSFALNFSCSEVFVFRTSPLQLVEFFHSLL